MDIQMLLSGIDMSEISNHLKEVINLVKTENALIKFEATEDKVYILLDISKNDVIAYRVTTGVCEIENKKRMEIKRTLGKWSLNDLKTLIGEGALPVENTLKRLLPIIAGFISLTKLEKHEKKVSIQLDITDTDINAYQIVLAIVKVEEKNKLFVSRVLGKYSLNEYLK